MARVAEILINRPSKHLDRTFSYRLPDALMTIGPGWRCTVPFNGRTEEGIILSVRDGESSGFSGRLKDVQAPLEAFPWFTSDMMALARWISSYYLCTYIDALRLFLIDKQGLRRSFSYEILWERIPADHPLRGLVDSVIREVSAEEAALLWKAEEIAAGLRVGWLRKKERTEASYRPPLTRWIQAEETIPQGVESPRRTRQRALWEKLRAEGPQTAKRMEEEGFSSAVQQAFCRNGMGHFFYRLRDTFSLIQKKEEKAPRVLTEEQQNAFSRIRDAVDNETYRGLLLMGVTGSGKTEVYLRAAEHARSRGGSVLILVPEIALTLQMVDYFSARFGDDVVFMHSKLSRGERYNNRMRIANGESHIVIGSRSALFLPYRHLRLIVVDEEYDSSYKQDETPYYNGRDAAKKLAVLSRCPIVLGAATPSVETCAAAEAGKIERIVMQERVHHTPLPRVHVVDMREEAAAVGSAPYSRVLLESVAETVRAGKKAILFLNRRGYATSLQCRACGHVFKCPNCDVSLVYHKARHSLHCHYCECVFPVPARCPACGGSDIAYTGYGTEKAEEQLGQYLPGILCERLDLDSTSRKHSAAQILDDFRSGRCQVLLGTQMVAKGHDIPGVQTVGILSADSILNRPTYLAAEQAFILMTQCAGRAGRGEEQGEVILQTYDPDHYVVRAAVKQDYQAFYEKEIRYRKALRYPPFTRMMKITCFSKIYGEAAKKAQAVSRWLVDALPRLPGQVSATPPYDEPIRKVRNTYYVSIMVKGESLLALKAAMRDAPFFRESGMIIDVDPLS